MPGETSLQAVARFENTELDDQDVAVVFSFGTNDVIQGVPAEESLQVLQHALTRCEAHDLAGCFVAPPMIRDLPAADASLSELSRRAGAICDERSVQHFSARAVLTDDGPWYAQAAAFDGAHPQADGYAELADALETDGLVEWLTKMAYR